jgi:hypothetical protein
LAVVMAATMFCACDDPRITLKTRAQHARADLKKEDEMVVMGQLAVS